MFFSKYLLINLLKHREYKGIHNKCNHKKGEKHKEKTSNIE